MTIRASSVRLTRLDPDGRPAGPSELVAAAGWCAPSEAVYELAGEPLPRAPWPSEPLQRMGIDVEFRDPNPVLLYLITGGALGWFPGRPRPLAVNGREYRRRVCRR